MSTRRQIGVVPLQLDKEIWICGGPAMHENVLASGVLEAQSIDAAQFNWNFAVIHVMLTGTGTAKLTVSGSFNGVNDIHSFGDRITGMVASPGSYILKLADTNLAYMPVLHFTFTETGGANPVNLRARVLGKMETNR